MVLKDHINIRIDIEYDGKNYFGWQKQKNKPSIQASIEESIQNLLNTDKIILTGAGRTDTGVHADNQVANFKIQKDLLRKFSMEKLIRSLNSILPTDISILKADIVPSEFNSRYDAKKRIYKYFFSLHKQALKKDRVYYFKNKFDLNTANEFCHLITGTYSFQTLCKNKSDNRDFRSIIYSCVVKKKKNKVFELEICGIRFLHSMVRAVTGAMLKVSSGQLSLADFKNKFLSGERLNIQYVPSYALFLHKIIY